MVGVFLAWYSLHLQEVTTDIKYFYQLKSATTVGSIEIAEQITGENVVENNGKSDADDSRKLDGKAQSTFALFSQGNGVAETKPAEHRR